MRCDVFHQHRYAFESRLIGDAAAHNARAEHGGVLGVLACRFRGLFG
ncbi:Uncharacterised protein [Vibrio cholerae]|nr:Uncharacterised protein [Vibrio cholerae]CSI11818.1 Uncharacterised protein [Vibrio cholerae]